MFKTLRSRIVIPVVLVVACCGIGVGTAAALSSSTTPPASTAHRALIHRLLSPTQLAQLPSKKRAALLAPPPSAASLPAPNHSVAACGGAAGCQVNGIMTTSQAPWSQQSFRVVNSYSGDFDGEHLLVYAGEENSATGGTGPASEGGIRIVLGTDFSTMQQYLLSTYAGWLKVSSVSDNVVVLTEEGGATVSFDLSSDSFSS